MTDILKIKGIDNVFLEVANLSRGVAFYQELGFKQKLALPEIKGVLFSIGDEKPGLILCERKPAVPSQMWVEVSNIDLVKEHCRAIELKGKEIETAAGNTFEIEDESGNIIGFADYTKKPELARSEKKDAPRQIAEAYAHRIWDNKDLTAIDEYIHEKCVIHSTLGDYYGAESMKRVIDIWYTAFPNLSVKNTMIISEKDLAVIHWQAQGAHQGEFKEIQPTGKCVSYEGVTIYRVNQDKIVEYWAYIDMQHLLKQISQQDEEFES